ncbi:MAG: DUF4870 domain-containing protein [Actinomycetota bacterium]
MSMGTGDEFEGGQPGGQAGGAAPAGWYPVDGGGQRYWDGSAWTEHIAPAPGATPPAPAPAAQPGSGFPAGVGDAEPAWGATPGQVPYGQSPAAYPPGAIAASSDDRSMATILHVLGLFTGFVGPLILWLVKKDESPFVDAHGKTALNFQFSMLIYWAVTFIAIFLLIGLLLIPVLMVIGFVLPIIAALAANKGEMYSYPLSIPFFK